MPLNIVFFEASKLVSTKTLLLKHHYRRQGDIYFFACACLCEDGIRISAQPIRF